MIRQRRTRNLLDRVRVGTLCVVMVAGCTASKVPFQYSATWVPEDEVPPPWSNAAISVVDQRSDRSVDKAITSAVEDAVGEALVAEVRGSRIAQQASYGAYPPDAPVADLLRQGIDAHLVAGIQELRWEIVNHASLLALTFAVALLTGLIGAAIMSTTKTDVDGHATVDVRWTDLGSDRAFRKTYVGHCEEEWPTFEADQAPAKARMAACALQLAMRDLRADLEAFAASFRPSTLPAP